MKQIFCPWVSRTMPQAHDQLQNLCRNRLGEANKSESASLAEFLTDSSAKTYFDQSVWGAYGNEWKWVALLTLLKLWTTDLQNVNYSHSDKIFGHDIDGLKLDRLSSPGGDVLFVEDGSNQERATTITKYSEKKWTILLQENSKHNGSGPSLSVTLSEGQLCIQEFVCLDGSRLRTQRASISAGMKKIDKNTIGTYLDVMLRGYKHDWDNGRIFMMLVAACFNDVEKVSLTVQEPSEKGDLIFTHLK